MRVPILAARTGWHTAQLCRALSERGHEGRVVAYEGLVARLGGGTGAGEAGKGQPGLWSCDEDLDAAGAVLARIIPAGSLEQIIYRVDALHRLEERGVVVLNPPRAIERTVDKFWTSTLLERAGIPVPETVVCERAEDAVRACRGMGDVIVKPLFGSMGLGMVRVSDEEIAFRVCRALDAIRAVYYVQRAIDHAGCDIRAFVVGDRVIAAVERRAEGGGWRTNLSRGARAYPCSLSSEWTALALGAARAVGAAYAGVDLLPARDGPTYVLEVNGIPGWRGLQASTGVDVAGAIVDHLLARTPPR
ncbi:MAG TPA: RimK family alpha-L-glutamate ligase [Gemmatimonadales bacterium]|nr:RimK family alpha-L-glutamate ligase [Gemmatimonadales bacterium]